jgi:hypothetical protein
MRLHAVAFAAVALLAAGTFGCGNSKQPGPGENAASGQQQPGAAAVPGSQPASAPGQPAPGVAPSQPAESAAPTQPAPPREVTLEAGTPVVVRTTTALSTNTNAAGERFAATLAEPLVVGDVVVAPKGAEVEGQIAEADKGGRVKGRARIAVRLVSVTTSNGERLPIATNVVSRIAPATKKKDAMKVGIGAGIGSIIGAIAGGGKGAAIGAGVGGAAGGGAVLATRGDPAKVPAESVLRFRLSAPASIAVR